MIIFIDIDNTICKTLDSDYENSIPIQENIEKVNKMYEAEHTITFWTARGNNSKNTSKLFHLTYNQLVKWKIKFHELRMGKPSYDLFIDDKNLNAIYHWQIENIEKILK